jgi:hypothetical protein
MARRQKRRNKKSLLSALIAYIEFTDLTPEELIDEAEKDRLLFDSFKQFYV